MISFASLQQFCHQKVPRRIWEALNFMLEPHTRQICGDCARRKNLVKKATLRILVYPVPKRLKIQWEENPETDKKLTTPLNKFAGNWGCMPWLTNGVSRPSKQIWNWCHDRICLWSGHSKTLHLKTRQGIGNYIVNPRNMHFLKHYVMR